MNTAIKYILKSLFYIFRLVSIEFKKLRFVTTPAPDDKETTTSKEKIAPQDLISDFFEVFKPTRIFFIFNILAFVIFLILPQGKDVILIVIEDLSRIRIGALFSLLFGVTCWSAIAEFGARYKIYVTDNSGKSLSGNRVYYRKQLQKFLSMVYLLLPFTLIFLGVSVVTFNNAGFFRDDNGWNWGVIIPYVVVIVSLIMTASFIARFYLDSAWNKKLNKNSWIYKIFKLPPEELRWVEKLYGIYNDYVFTIRKESFFKGKKENNSLKRAYIKYVAIAKKLPVEKFPDDYIIAEEQAPHTFRPPVHFSNEYKPDLKNSADYHYVRNPSGSYRWIYKNTPAFYKTLHRQVKIITFFSLAAIILISLIPSAWIGSPGLVCLSFGCWQGIYTGLLYIDYRYRSKSYISARWLILIWFIIVSAINRDHPVRYNTLCSLDASRNSVSLQFDKWVQQYKGNDSLKKTFIVKKDSSIWYPAIFITAEGGALRTGAFTAMMLGVLQDSFHLFRDNIFSYSTVSGGSVGVSFFNAINYLDKDSAAYSKDTDYYQNITRKFFLNDQLSPVLSKTFYGDVLNYFWPHQFEKFDREIALEKAWERDYHELFNKRNDRNIYSESFTSFNNSGRILPAWFINTTEVETGMQCFLSNVSADSFLYGHQRDLVSSRLRAGINYSTAVGFSTRFPLFSPSAAVYQNDERTYHYVDGGYVENTGSKTMLEVLQNLRKKLDSYHIIPYIIQLKFGEEDKFSSSGFLNELSSIFNGIYNTRSANTAIYSSLLKTYSEDSLQGKFISVPLEMSKRNVPMSWVLSERSMENLDTAINRIMKNTKNDLHQKLYLFNRDTTIKVYNIK